MDSEDKKFLNLAIDNAKESVSEGGFPAGVVVVKDGTIVSEGISVGFKLHDPTSHAETAAIRGACKKLKTTDLTGATLYESIECCNMCFSVAYWSGISRIVYAAKKTVDMVKKGYYEGAVDNGALNKVNNRQIELVHIPKLEQKSFSIINDWESQGGFDK
jgi:tRNA(Arg) A34 adenosine deaminase TadA